MKTMVNDFYYRGEHFSIVYDGKFYMTVNHKFIGNDGKLIKELHYNDGLHPAGSVAECIKQTKEDLDMDYYVAQGKSKAEALSIVCNIPLELAQMVYSK